MRGKKVAVVHDWLVDSGGAEKVLEAILKLYPNADVFTLVCFMDKDQVSYLKGRTVNTSFIQTLPLAKKKYRSYLPLMPFAIERFDFSEYDLVVSSSFCVAKGIITGPDQLHVCYCHSPMRYAWDLREQYLIESGLDKGLKGLFARYLLHKMRSWDLRSSFGVDYFIANSNFIAKRIRKTYRRDAKVIYPNVAVDDFEISPIKSDFYFTCSRMVPYKKIDLIVESFSLMPDKKLIVIGDGPDMDKIKSKAGVNVEILGRQEFSVLKDYMSRARAFIFAAEEDFGIVPVEAQASGTPVIAFKKGGALETVVDGVTGVFFEDQTVDSIVRAVLNFEVVESSFNLDEIKKHADTFSENEFLRKLKHHIDECIVDYFD